MVNCMQSRYSILQLFFQCQHCHTNMQQTSLEPHFVVWKDSFAAQACLLNVLLGHNARGQPAPQPPASHAPHAERVRAWRKLSLATKRSGAGDTLPCALMKSSRAPAVSGLPSRVLQGTRCQCRAWLTACTYLAR